MHVPPPPGVSGSNKNPLYTYHPRPKCLVRKRIPSNVLHRIGAISFIAEKNSNILIFFRYRRTVPRQSI